MKVRIIQLLCPLRHCILASVYESPDGREMPERIAEMRAQVDSGSIGLNPWCGLCHSRELYYEDRATRFRTIEEAMPHLLKLESEQTATREFLGRGQN